MQAARDLINPVVELAAGVERREDDLDGGLPLGLVDIDRYAAPVIGDRDGVVGMDHDVDIGGVASHAFVYGVVDDLVDQVVQAARGGVADVHGRPFPDRVDALE